MVIKSIKAIKYVFKSIDKRIKRFFSENGGYKKKKKNKVDMCPATQRDLIESDVFFY